jgi:(4S)-4-hydroxy-5-phosphonooxypentane-2,3-dione isomerase
LLWFWASRGRILIGSRGIKSLELVLVDSSCLFLSNVAALAETHTANLVRKGQQVEMFLSRLRCSSRSFPIPLCQKTFSTSLTKYPDFNQVILSRGKTKSNTIQQFYPLAIQFSQLLVQNMNIPRFDILKDSKDPSSFVFLEVYNAAEAFEQHVQSAQFDQFQVVAEPLLEDPFELEEFKTIYPDQVTYSWQSLSVSLSLSLPASSSPLASPDRCLLISLPKGWMEYFPTIGS